MAEEMLEIVDGQGKVVGTAPRSECHGNPELCHRAVHVIIHDRSGRILLQKRSMGKDIQPGRWDTSVGGHLDPGEDYERAAARELKEELGLENVELELLGDSEMKNEIEHELHRTFSAVSEGPFKHHPVEIDEIRFWTLDEIDNHLGTGIFTPNFEYEYARWVRGG